MEKVVPGISSVFIVLKANQWDGFYEIVNDIKRQSWCKFVNTSQRRKH